MTRADLETAILAFLRRGTIRASVESFPAISTFITLAETNINGPANPPEGTPPGCRARCQVLRVGIEATGRYVTLPDDFLEMDDLRCQGGPSLHYWPRAQAGDADRAQSVPDLPAPSNVGSPVRFAVVGFQLELWPAPGEDSGITLEMAYFRRQTLGAASSATNAILSHVPNAYLYGALAHAAMFLADDERVASYAALYAAAVNAANAEYRQANIGRGPLTQHFRSIG